MSKRFTIHDWKIDPFKKTSIAFSKNQYKPLLKIMNKWDCSQGEAIKRCIEIVYEKLIK
jgi:hypothetical protein